MSGPSASMLDRANICTAKIGKSSNTARDTIEIVQNNYNINTEAFPIKHFIDVESIFITEVHKNDHSQSNTSDSLPQLAFSDHVLQSPGKNDHSRSNTRKATGTDASDSRPKRTSSNHVPQSPIEVAHVGNMVPDNPSSLPVASIADLYTRSLLTCFAGYPLYNPEPFSELSSELYSRNGVNVGDVGFVRETGTFDFLFNICPSQNNSINPPGLPDGFSLEEDPTTTKLNQYTPNHHLFRTPVTRTNSGEYICEGPEGAVLELPEGAVYDDVIRRLPFANLAACHGVKWYKYTMSRGRDFPNGSLYLITSVTKCSRWGIAVFNRPCAPGQGLKFINKTPFASFFRRSTSKYRWKGLDSCNTKVADGNIANQCVFLQGYKIMIRQEKFDDLRQEQLRVFQSKIPPSFLQGGNINVSQGPADRPRGGGGTDPFSKRLKEGILFTETTKPTVMKSGEVILYANFNSSLIHPSDFINAALLSQNPNADIALTHDDVWCSLLKDHFPKINHEALINLAKSYTSIVDEFGCVSLKKSDSSNVETESLPLPKPVQSVEKARNPEIAVPVQESSTRTPQLQAVDGLLEIGDEDNPGISVPPAPLTTPELGEEEYRLKDKVEEIRKKELEEEECKLKDRVEEIKKKGEELEEEECRLKDRVEEIRKKKEELEGEECILRGREEEIRNKEEGLEEEECKLKDRVEEIRKKEEELEGKECNLRGRIEEIRKKEEELYKEERKLRDRAEEIQKKEKELEEERKLKDKAEEIRKEEEVRKWEEQSRLTDYKVNMKALEAGRREEEISRRESEAKQMESKNRLKELAIEEKIRCMTEEVRCWQEEMERKEMEIKEWALQLAKEMTEEVRRWQKEMGKKEMEKKERALYLAKEMRQKADEARKREENPMTREELEWQREHDKQRQRKHERRHLINVIFLILPFLFPLLLFRTMYGTMPTQAIPISPPSPPPPILIPPNPPLPSCIPPSSASSPPPPLLRPSPPPLLPHLPRIPYPPPLSRPRPPPDPHLKSPHIPLPPPFLRPKPPPVLHLKSPFLPPLIRPVPIRSPLSNPSS